MMAHFKHGAGALDVNTMRGSQLIGPVGGSAQAKVTVPDGLDLDAPMGLVLAPQVVGPQEGAKSALHSLRSGDMGLKMSWRSRNRVVLKTISIMATVSCETTTTMKRAVPLIWWLWVKGECCR